MPDTTQDFPSDRKLSPEDAVEQLDYDETHSTPVSSESILMEGWASVHILNLLTEKVKKLQLMIIINTYLSV